MRTILHIDMDAYFASVEIKCNPQLKGKPVIVCCDPEKRSVVSSASYDAREFGVKAGMPVNVARDLCSHGAFVEGSPERYIYYSIRLLEVYKRYTPLVEPFSIDEAFLELTGTEFEETHAKECALMIKRDVSREFGLTCSIGIGPNKYIAKMASPLKKPDGLSELDYEKYRSVFSNKPVDSLWGVGEKTKKKLERLGIHKVRDILGANHDSLKESFGEFGNALVRIAKGEDNTSVVPYFEGVEPKSMGHEHTFSKDVTERDVLIGTLLRLSDQVGRRLRKDGYQGKTVRIKVRYSDFTTFTRQLMLDSFTDESGAIFKTALRLFELNVSRNPVRLLGVSVSNLGESRTPEPGLFAATEKKKNITLAIDSLKDRFGENILARGMSLHSFLSRR